MNSWQVHWASVADTGNGPLRITGYGDSPETAQANMNRGLAANLATWDAEATTHRAAVDEVRALLAKVTP